MNYSHDDPPHWNGKSWPKGWFKDLDHRISYLEWLGKKLDYSTPKDWYQVRTKDFEDNKGANLLYRYYGPIINAMRDLYPDYDWKMWLFAGGVPNNYWEKSSNRHKYMDWLGNELGYSKPVCWYGVTKRDFVTRGGSSFLQFFENSPSTAVITIYRDDYDWLTWKFDTCPNGFWNRDKNIRAYLEWLAKELDYSSPKDWYTISSKLLIANYGSSLLGNIWHGKPSTAAYFFYPVYDWLPWRFNQVPPNWWKDVANQKRYLLWLGRKLEISTKDGWYKIKKRNFSENYGGRFLHEFNNSPSEAIMQLYPIFRWRPWLFHQTRKGYWNDRENRCAYMDWLGEILEYRKCDDWYDVGQKTILKNHGRGALKIFSHSIPALMEDVYPDYDWKPEKFAVGLKSQKRMLSLIRKLYPDSDPIWEYRCSELKFSTGKKMKMKFDVFVPEINFIFEYQGEQHFMAMAMYGGEEALKSQQGRDAEKRRACAAMGITLIEVPYWWDHSKAKLEQIIEAGPGMPSMPDKEAE